MPISYEIKYADGRIEEDWGSDGLYYVFTDGRTLRMQTTVGWCSSCNRIGEIESLPYVQEKRDFDQVLDEIFGAGFTEASAKSVVPGDEIPGVDLQNLLAESRQSPPRCIACGSTETHAIPFGEMVDSPTGNERFQVELIGFADTEYMDWAFDLEGNRIN